MASTMFTFELVAMAMVMAMLQMVVSTVEAACTAPPAIYVFGDSTVDVGNNNFLPGRTNKANFPPNGIDFPSGVPTGRFSNGFNLADSLAKKIGFEKSPPSSFSALRLGISQVPLNGVNFASGGSGILDTTRPDSSLPMNKQILQFKTISKRITKKVGRRAAERHFSNAIFILSTGSNDFFENNVTFVYQSNTQRTTFINGLVMEFKGQIMDLYDLGGRRFAVIGVGGIGCVPGERAANAMGSCNNGLNEAAGEFVEATGKMLSGLTSSCRGKLKYSFVRSDAIGPAIFLKFSELGFEEGITACCGSGRFNAEIPCAPDSNLCADRRSYVFWDFVHPTQAFYEVTAEYAYEGDLSVATPMNLRNLSTISI